MRFLSLSLLVGVLAAASLLASAVRASRLYSNQFGSHLASGGDEGRLTVNNDNFVDGIVGPTRAGADPFGTELLPSSLASLDAGGSPCSSTYGCKETSCECGMLRSCYPMTVPAQAGGLKEVGVCSLSMPVLVLIAVMVFVGVLLAVVFTRMYLQWVEWQSFPEVTHPPFDVSDTLLAPMAPKPFDEPLAGKLPAWQSGVQGSSAPPPQPQTAQAPQSGLASEKTQQQEEYAAAPALVS
eukprot:TRINITY_DN8049_c0_g1_i2.p1 TRINITY_DN8049_c0_g1~~TRINITY_DN8049_c0_g1_i2.p1  ORF type:complete len:239 (-),score=49.58 TRINITY_DN8049_c0_g1_i2:78-794(-)